MKNVAVILGDPRKPDPIKLEGKFNKEDFETVDKLKEALSSLRDYNFIYLDDHDRLMADLKQSKIDFVFNLCDEGLYNQPEREADIPRMLEKLGLPYTGADASCLIKCYNKSYVKKFAKRLGIDVPKGFLIKDKLKNENLKFPVIVKPNSADGGFGITRKSIAYNLEQLIEAIENFKARPILVEEFLEGSDLTAGIIGNPPDCIFLPIIEEDYSILPKELPKISGYEAKWDPNSVYWQLKSKPAQLDENTKKVIEKNCLILFKELKCKDYARFDWRLDEKGKPRLLEVNPNPGWCWDGHLAKMCSYAGISYSEMLAYILKAAEKRLGI